MKKDCLRDKIRDIKVYPYEVDVEKILDKEQKIEEILNKFENRIAGKRGAEAARDRFAQYLDNMYIKRDYMDYKDYNSDSRYRNWKKKQSLKLAALVDIEPLERGKGISYPGDHIVRVVGRDYVGPWESHKPPYFDMGAAGLGLIECERKRVYSRSSGYSPSYVTTVFLVGKNESGSYFTHAVSPHCRTVEEAVQWIWGGKASQIIQRQGDVALIVGKGPKMPATLPDGHIIQGDVISHDTHIDLPMPKTGERIIVGRRAAERAIEAVRD